jgi:hypothetical protein
MLKPPLAPTVGDLLAQQAISREEVERAAVALFDGETELPVTKDIAIDLPPFHSLDQEVRQAILSALLRGRPVHR